MLKIKSSLPSRLISAVIILTFSSSLIVPPNSYAQTLPGVGLPTPGAMVTMSPGFTPILIKGIKVHPENPLEFDFIVDTGDSNLAGEELKEESKKLIKYFLASLTTPEEELWVNLSPYEEGRIVPDKLGATELGRDLLAQDYLLKQLTASLIYPEDELGKKFWDRVKKLSYERYGTTDIPMETFNKVWIVPEEAVVYENGDVAFVVKSRLKVMMEEDYIAAKANGSSVVGIPSSVGERNTNDEIRTTSSEILKELIIPEIEKEINEGKNFALLRQIYHSVILSGWFKTRLKESLVGQVYADQNKTAGINLDDPSIKQKIYAQYLEAYKKGVYNYIKEDEEYFANTVRTVPRKYFSGGLQIGVTNPGLGVAPVLQIANDPVVLGGGVLRPEGAANAVKVLLAEGLSEAAVVPDLAALQQAAANDNQLLADAAMVAVTFSKDVTASRLAEALGISLNDIVIEIEELGRVRGLPEEGDLLLEAGQKVHLRVPRGTDVRRLLQESGLGRLSDVNRERDRQRASSNDAAMVSAEGLGITSFAIRPGYHLTFPAFQVELEKFLERTDFSEGISQPEAHELSRFLAQLHVNDPEILKKLTLDPGQTAQKGYTSVGLYTSENKQVVLWAAGYPSGNFSHPHIHDSNEYIFEAYVPVKGPIQTEMMRIRRTQDINGTTFYEFQRGETVAQQPLDGQVYMEPRGTGIHRNGNPSAAHEAWLISIYVRDTRPERRGNQTTEFHPVDRREALELGLGANAAWHRRVSPDDAAVTGEDIHTFAEHLRSQVFGARVNAISKVQPVKIAVRLDEFQRFDWKFPVSEYSVDKIVEFVFARLDVSRIPNDYDIHINSKAQNEVVITNKTGAQVWQVNVSYSPLEEISSTFQAAFLDGGSFSSEELLSRLYESLEKVYGDDNVDNTPERQEVLQKLVLTYFADDGELSRFSQQLLSKIRIALEPSLQNFINEEANRLAAERPELWKKLISLNTGDQRWMFSRFVASDVSDSQMNVRLGFDPTEIVVTMSNPAEAEEGSIRIYEPKDVAAYRQKHNLHSDTDYYLHLFQKVVYIARHLIKKGVNPHKRFEPTYLPSLNPMLTDFGLLQPFLPLRDLAAINPSGAEQARTRWVKPQVGYVSGDLLRLARAVLLPKVAEFLGGDNATPLVEAPALSEAIFGKEGKRPRIYLKLETQTPIGSYKLWGALNKLLFIAKGLAGNKLNSLLKRIRQLPIADMESELDIEPVEDFVLKRLTFITPSQGNHAQGVTVAANEIGAQNLIVVSDTISPIKRTQIESRGGNLKIVAGGFDEAFKEAVYSEIENEGMIMVSPAEPLVIAGHGGAIGIGLLDQSYQKGFRPDAVLVSTGTAALSAGIGLALAHEEQLRFLGDIGSGVALEEDQEKNGIRLIGVETEGADALFKSVTSGRFSRLPGVDTLADGKAVKSPGLIPYLMWEHGSGIAQEVVRTERQLIDIAIWLLNQTEDIKVEGAAALALTPILQDPERFRDMGEVVVVLTGENIDPKLLDFVLGEGPFLQGLNAKLKQTSLAAMAREEGWKIYEDISEISENLRERDRVYTADGGWMRGPEAEQYFLASIDEELEIYKARIYVDEGADRMFIDEHPVDAAMAATPIDWHGSERWRGKAWEDEEDITRRRDLLIGASDQGATIDIHTEKIHTKITIREDDQPVRGRVRLTAEEGDVDGYPGYQIVDIVYVSPALLTLIEQKRAASVDMSESDEGPQKLVIFVDAAREARAYAHFMIYDYLRERGDSVTRKAVRDAVQAEKAAFERFKTELEEGRLPAFQQIIDYFIRVAGQMAFSAFINDLAMSERDRQDIIALRENPGRLARLNQEISLQELKLGAEGKTLVVKSESDPALLSEDLSEDLSEEARLVATPAFEPLIHRLWDQLDTFRDQYGHIPQGHEEQEEFARRFMPILQEWIGDGDNRDRLTALQSLLEQPEGAEQYKRNLIFADPSRQIAILNHRFAGGTPIHLHGNEEEGHKMAFVIPLDHGVVEEGFDIEELPSLDGHRRVRLTPKKEEHPDRWGVGYLTERFATPHHVWNSRSEKPVAGVLEIYVGTFREIDRLIPLDVQDGNNSLTALVDTVPTSELPFRLSDLVVQQGWTEIIEPVQKLDVLTGARILYGEDGVILTADPAEMVQLLQRWPGSVVYQSPEDPTRVLWARRSLRDRAMVAIRLDPSTATDAVHPYDASANAGWNIANISFDVDRIDLDTLNEESVVAELSPATGIVSKLFLERLRSEGKKIKKLVLVEVDLPYWKAALNSAMRDLWDPADNKIRERYRDVVDEIEFRLLPQKEGGLRGFEMASDAIPELVGEVDLLLWENAAHLAGEQLRLIMESNRKLLKPQAQMILGSGSFVRDVPEGDVYVDSPFELVWNEVIWLVENDPEFSEFLEIWKDVSEEERREAWVAAFETKVFPKKPSLAQVESDLRALGFSFATETPRMRLDQEGYGHFVLDSVGMTEPATTPFFVISVQSSNLRRLQRAAHLEETAEQVAKLEARIEALGQIPDRDEKLKRLRSEAYSRVWDNVRRQQADAGVPVDDRGLYMAWTSIAATAPIADKAMVAEHSRIARPEDMPVWENIANRILWLSTRMIHEANYDEAGRKRGELPKVGGHQAAAASSLHIMLALHLFAKRAEDHVADKPHAAPVFYALQYLLGHEAMTKDRIKRLRQNPVVPAENVAVESFISENPDFEAEIRELVDELEGQLPSESLGNDQPGLHSYPGMVDSDIGVTIPTGSVGMGPAAAIFLAIKQKWLAEHGFDLAPSHYFAVLGDGEFSEGNLHEALIEADHYEVDNVTHIVDFNRQSLDGDQQSGQLERIKGVYEANHWEVIELKWGRRIQAAFESKNGDVFQAVMESLDDEEYQKLTAKDGSYIRNYLLQKAGGDKKLIRQKGKLRAFLNGHSDEELYEFFTDLGGHDLVELTQALEESRSNGKPTVIVAHTIKGWGLRPLIGNPLNHSGMLNKIQLEKLRQELEIPGTDPFMTFVEEDLADGDVPRFEKEQELLQRVARRTKREERMYRSRLEEDIRFFDESIDPADLPVRIEPEILRPQAVRQKPSTQAAMGHIMSYILSLKEKPEESLTPAERNLRRIAERYITIAPDVGLSTSITINRRVFGEQGLRRWFDILGLPEKLLDTTPSAQGDHFQLSIAEMNAVTLAAALGKADFFDGQPLFPVVAIYDMFLFRRALDPFFYAQYWGSRFLALGTPSGATLAPEGAQHQSILSLMIALGMPNTVAWAPWNPHELAVIEADRLRRIVENDDEGRNAVYYRLTTLPADMGALWDRLKSNKRYQGKTREQIQPDWEEDVLKGGYRLVDYRGYKAGDVKANLKEGHTLKDYDPDDNVVNIVAMGPAVEEALAASDALLERGIYANVIVVTSPTLLYGNLAEKDNYAHLRTLLPVEERDGAPVVTVADAAPLSLGGIGVLGLTSGIAHLGITDNGRSTRSPHGMFRVHGISRAHIAAKAYQMLAGREYGEEGERTLRRLGYGDLAMISEDVSAFLGNVSNPYDAAMIRRLQRLKEKGLVDGAGAAMIDEISVPESDYGAWLDVELKNPAGEFYPARVFVARARNNTINGSGKGGIRWITATDLFGNGKNLNGNKEFKRLLDELNARGGTKADLEELIARWIRGETRPLSLGMTIKGGGLSLPFGGGKGAVFVGRVVEHEDGSVGIEDYEKWETFSRYNVAAIARAHSRAMARKGLIGIDIDIPAPDEKTNRQTMAFYGDEYLRFLIEERPDLIVTPGLERVLRSTRNLFDNRNKKYNIEETPLLRAAVNYWFNGGDIRPVPEIGVFTSKPIELGGIPGRAEATGYGVVDLILGILELQGEPIRGKTVSFHGAGNVALYAARRLAEMGAVVKTLSNRTIALTKKNEGWTAQEIQIVLDASEKKIKLHTVFEEGFEGRSLDWEAFDAVFDEGERNKVVFESDVDILVPAATEGVITMDNAGEVKADIIVEGANGSTVPEAALYFAEQGKVFVTDTLANAGGVTVSDLEVFQAVLGRQFIAEEAGRIRNMLLIRALRAALQKQKEIRVQFGEVVTLQEAFDLVVIDVLVKNKALRWQDNMTPLERLQEEGSRIIALAEEVRTAERKPGGDEAMISMDGYFERNSTGRPIIIILVEDNPDMMSLYDEIFGFSDLEGNPQVVIVPDYAAAQNALAIAHGKEAGRKDRLALLVTDANFPAEGFKLKRLAGIELMEREKATGTVVFMVSGEETWDLFDEGSVRPDHFFQKPVSPQELLAAVNEVLRAKLGEPALVGTVDDDGAMVTGSIPVLTLYDGRFAETREAVERIAAIPDGRTGELFSLYPWDESVLEGRRLFDEKGRLAGRIRHNLTPVSMDTKRKVIDRVRNYAQTLPFSEREIVEEILAFLNDMIIYERDETQTDIAPGSLLATISGGENDGKRLLLSAQPWWDFEYHWSDEESDRGQMDERISTLFMEAAHFLEKEQPADLIQKLFVEAGEALRITRQEREPHSILEASRRQTFEYTRPAAVGIGEGDQLLIDAPAGPFNLTGISLQDGSGQRRARFEPEEDGAPPIVRVIRTKGRNAKGREVVQDVFYLSPRAMAAVQEAGLPLLMVMNSWRDVGRTNPDGGVIRVVRFEQAGLNQKDILRLLQQSAFLEGAERDELQVAVIHAFARLALQDQKMSDVIVDAFQETGPHSKLYSNRLVWIMDAPGASPYYRIEKIWAGREDTKTDQGWLTYNFTSDDGAPLAGREGLLTQEILALEPELLRIGRTPLDGISLSAEQITAYVAFIQGFLTDDVGAAGQVGDAALVGNPTGGIDLNKLNLQIKRDGNGVALPVNLQDLEKIRAGFEGFLPVIIDMVPVSVPMLLGLEDQQEDRKTTRDGRGKEKPGMPVGDLSSISRRPSSIYRLPLEKYAGKD